MKIKSNVKKKDIKDNNTNIILYYNTCVFLLLFKNVK